MKPTGTGRRVLIQLTLNSLIACAVAFVIYVAITASTGGGLGGTTVSSGLLLALVTFAVSFAVGGVLALLARRGK